MSGSHHTHWKLRITHTLPAFTLDGRGCNMCIRFYYEQWGLCEFRGGEATDVQMWARAATSASVCVSHESAHWYVNVCSWPLRTLVSLVIAGICSLVCCFIREEDDDVHEQLPCLMLSGLVIRLSAAVPWNKHQPPLFWQNLYVHKNFSFPSLI